MAGKKGIKHYPNIIKEEVIRKQRSGESVCSLSKEYGISRYAIQSWCGLRPEKESTLKASRKRGRNGKQTLTEDEKDNEIKRLKMENDLLRTFLQVTGRR